MFNIGDKVRIRPDLREDDNRFHYGVSAAMEELAGRTMTVVGLNLDPAGVVNYDLDDGFLWSWSEDMFEAPTPRDLLRPGYMVRYRNGRYAYVAAYERDGEEHLTFIDAKDQSWMDPEAYTDDLVKESDAAWSVDKILGLPKGRTFYDFTPDSREVLWEREEIKEMTVAEIEEKLGYKVKVVKG